MEVGLIALPVTLRGGAPGTVQHSVIGGGRKKRETKLRGEGGGGGGGEGRGRDRQLSVDCTFGWLLLGSNHRR